MYLIYIAFTGLIGPIFIYGVPMANWIYAHNNEPGHELEGVHLVFFIVDIAMWIFQTGMGVYEIVFVIIVAFS